jgi:hypothetical protein
LIFLALQAVLDSYQQSYPQKYWMAIKVLMNQALRGVFEASCEHLFATAPLTWPS